MRVITKVAKGGLGLQKMTTTNLALITKLG
jgi:hypothetical protein